MELADIPYISAATAIAVILLTIYYFVQNRNVLPGPTGFPFLGLYPYLTKENVHLKLDEYKKKYGDLFSFTYCGRLFINLGSAKAMREVHFSRPDDFADRLTDYYSEKFILGKNMVTINGEAWKILRKFFMQRLQDNGFYTVREDMARPVYDTMNATIEDLKALKGKPIGVVELVTQKCPVAMRKIIFGEKGISDEEVLQLAATYHEVVDGMTGLILLMTGTLARLLCAIDPKCRRAGRRDHVLLEILLSCAKKIEHSMDEEHPTCIIEDYYKERNERRRKNDPSWKIFTDDLLVRSLLQFIGDGITGVAVIICASLNALIKYPEEQDKLYTELLNVVGPNRQPTIEDKGNLPYVNAFMNEIIREYSFLRLYPSVECKKESIIRGYRIPKGSVTLLNFFSANNDLDTYEDPGTFRPSRYIPEPGKPKPTPPVLFGIGKRSCIGEVFVMTQYFLFLTTIVKNFKVVSSNDPTKKTIDFFITGQSDLILYPRTEN